MKKQTSKIYHKQHNKQHNTLNHEQVFYIVCGTFYLFAFICLLTGVDREASTQQVCDDSRRAFFRLRTFPISIPVSRNNLPAFLFLLFPLLYLTYSLLFFLSCFCCSRHHLNLDEFFITLIQVHKFRRTQPLQNFNRQ